jgi:hypothetical protein
MVKRMPKRGTSKQIQRAILLLRKANYNTAFIDANFKRLGATMSDNNCIVESWLAAKTASELDMLIERLQNVTRSDEREKSMTAV